MDRSELTNAILPFVEECKRRGYPLKDFCLEEAFPGDSSTSYLLKVTAEWIDYMDCSGALDILIDILWDTVNEARRTYIFAIIIRDKNEQLHCFTQNMSRQSQLPFA